MEPPIRNNPNTKLLPRSVASVTIISNDYMEPPGMAKILVASAPPMLPLPNLPARFLLPHLIRVVETLRVFPVGLQCEIFLRLRIVFRVFTMGPANGDVVRPPRELLGVRAKIREGNGPSVVGFFAGRDVRDPVEILVYFREFLQMRD